MDGWMLFSPPEPPVAEVELALAASARRWADSLHRFLADHGGARVRTVVMGPEEAIAESYDVLIIDDVSSFLTPRLVGQIQRLGRQIVGVFDVEDGADAKRRLLSCGIDNMVESDAQPEEFLAVVVNLVRMGSTGRELSHPPAVRKGQVVVVGAPQGGCGATEVAVEIARLGGSVLVDADDVVPSVAQRVGASLHPNLRTAIDVVHHRSGDLTDVLTDAEGFSLVAGLVGGDDRAQVHPGEVEAVVEELAALRSSVIVNLSSGLERPRMGDGRFGLAGALVGMADEVVAVGLPDPVGVTRLVRWVSEAQVLNPVAPVHIVMNRAPRSAYRRSEVSAEIERIFVESDLTFLPEDPRVSEAGWEGACVSRGPFVRAVRKVARRVLA